MKTRLLALLVLGCVAGCDRPAEKTVSEASPTPTATPEPGYVGQGTEPAPAAEPPVEIQAVETVNLDAENRENQLVKAEVLDRIDVMPNLSDEEKDKLYVQVERARGMGKVITIPFSSGKRSIAASDLSALASKLTLPQIQKFTEDPTVVFVILGFADKKGDPQQNLAISRERAQSVEKMLKERCGVMNVVHSVGMGSSEMFDVENLDKNRVVEVWAVLP